MLDWLCLLIRVHNFEGYAAPLPCRNFSSLRVCTSKLQLSSAAMSH
jgi:hypothetical protein